MPLSAGVVWSVTVPPHSPKTVALGAIVPLGRATVTLPSLLPGMASGTVKVSVIVTPAAPASGAERLTAGADTEPAADTASVDAVTGITSATVETATGAVPGDGGFTTLLTTIDTVVEAPTPAVPV